MILPGIPPCILALPSFQIDFMIHEWWKDFSTQQDSQTTPEVLEELSSLHPRVLYEMEQKGILSVEHVKMVMAHKLKISSSASSSTSSRPDVPPARMPRVRMTQGGPEEIPPVVWEHKQMSMAPLLPFGRSISGMPSRPSVPEPQQTPADALIPSPRPGTFPDPSYRLLFREKEDFVTAQMWWMKFCRYAFFCYNYPMSPDEIDLL